MEVSGAGIKQASIIVCTVARFADLERCLASLEPFQAAGAEIIIVNNGPHGAEVAEIAQRHHAQVTTETARGVGRARNAGIRAASGSIVAFLDDDSTADPNWLPLLLAPLQDPQVQAVVGRISPQTLADPVSQAFDSMHRAEFPESRFTVEPSQNPFPLRPALVGNANMAARHEVFERCGYFDVRFGRGTRIGSGEEPDLLLRVLLGGGKIVVEPAARIFHRHATEWRAVRQWAFHSGCAHTALLTKYFFQKGTLRGPILRYAASRLRPEKGPGRPAPGAFQVPRIPMLLGSLYGPLAFIVSPKS